jgi:hypothetical protein
MFRYRLRTLLILLAIAPPVLAGAWYVHQAIELGRDEYDLFHNPARYGELEQRLIDKGIATRGPGGELCGTPKFLNELRNKD